MRSLPFIVQPKRKVSVVRLGNEDIGFIEIERRGYLNVSEKTFVDSLVNNSDTITSTVALATRISVATKKTVEECYQGIMLAMQGDEESKFAVRIKTEYPSEISELMSNFVESLNKRGIAAATILIQTRIDHDWTVEDTLSQHPDMIEILHSFYNQEEAGHMPEEVDQSGKPEETFKEQAEKASEIVGK